MNAIHPSSRATTRGALTLALLFAVACDAVPTAPVADVEAVRSEKKKDTAPTLTPPEVEAYVETVISREEDIVQSIWAGCLRSGQANLVGTPYGVGANCRIVNVDGYPRRFVVYVPEKPKHGHASPLVLMHHGSSGTGEKFYNISGWKEEADRKKFLVAFPTGLEYDVLDAGYATKWNDYSLPDMVDVSWRLPGYPPTSPWPADDVSFIGAVLDDIESQEDIDAHRIYSAGFSSGSAFTARLSIEMSDRFAAVAQFAGGLVSAYEPVQRIPVAWLLGSKDDKVIGAVNAMMEPGGEAITELSLDPDAILSYTAIAIGLAATRASFDLDDEPAQVKAKKTSTRFQWHTPLPGNEDGNELAYGLLAGVAHHYPHLGSPQSVNPNGFSAAQLFWKFFSDHPKP